MKDVKSVLEMANAIAVRLSDCFALLAHTEDGELSMENSKSSFPIVVSRQISQMCTKSQKEQGDIGHY